MLLFLRLRTKIDPVWLVPPWFGFETGFQRLPEILGTP